MKNIYNYTGRPCPLPPTAREAWTKSTDLPLPQFPYLKNEANDNLPCWITDCSNGLEASLKQ